MQSMFNMGVRQMGQYGGYWPNPYTLEPVRTPSIAPAVPPPPAFPPSIPRKVDDATRRDLLGIIAAAKQQRANVAAWSANKDVKAVLGTRYPEYTQYLTDSMAQDELVEILDFRLNVPGEAYIQDWEVANLKKYQEANQKLVELIEGKTKVAIPTAPSEEKDLLLPGGVAVAAFMAAFLV